MAFVKVNCKDKIRILNTDDISYITVEENACYIELRSMKITYESADKDYLEVSRTECNKLISNLK